MSICVEGRICGGMFIIKVFFFPLTGENLTFSLGGHVWAENEPSYTLHSSSVTTNGCLSHSKNLGTGHGCYLKVQALH